MNDCQKTVSQIDPIIAVIVPAYNEQKKIAAMLATIPQCVSRIFVINDASTDSTADVVQQAGEADSRILLINHEGNQGVGAAIVTGYRRAITDGIDIAVVMAGDGQMAADDFDAVVAPVASGACDYAKGNRFLNGRAEIANIPKHRLVGNLLLSVLTKIASGYWHVSDSQSGYTAINRRALTAIDWSECYPRYGCPNDYLVRLNIANMRVADVPVAAIYGPDWRSHMKPFKIALPMLRLLVRLFLTRMFRKYVVANGHPLVIFYFVSIIGYLVTFLLFCYVVIRTLLTGIIPQTATILWGMSATVSTQVLLHSFAIDYQDNERLYVHDR